MYIQIFVMDYLPQRINLNYSVFDTFISYPIEKTNSALTSKTARVYFSNLEGTERVVIECMRQGLRVPTKIEINDFKVGYYDMAIDRTTTFTAVAYNKNGYTRGLPITVSPFVQSPLTEIPINFKLGDNKITILCQDEINHYDYSISPVNSEHPLEFTGSTNGIIDISSLSDGIYILTVYESHSGLQKTFKFKK